MKKILLIVFLALLTCTMQAGVASVNGTDYETLADALAVGEGNTVTLLADINLGSAVLTVDKAVVIDGQDHVITSSAGSAIVVVGSGNVTFQNVSITASAGHAVQVGSDGNAFSGQLVLSKVQITAAKRGVRVYEEATGFALSIDQSLIQSTKASPTTTYTTGNDAMALSLGTTNNAGYTVDITDTTLQGFSYLINGVSSGNNLTVNMTGGSGYARALCNMWGSNNVVTLKGVEFHGLNNQTGPTEAFACIVDNSTARNNVYNINGCTFTATLSDAAINTSGSTATQQLLMLSGQNATVNIMGATTYSCNDNERGGLATDAGGLLENTVAFDETAKDNLESFLGKAEVATEPDANGMYGVTYDPEVYYYWDEGGEEKGVYCDFRDPFVNGWLADGESIRLLKNVDLNLTSILCQLTSGHFNIEFGSYSAIKGVVYLHEGVSVTSDKVCAYTGGATSVSATRLCFYAIDPDTKMGYTFVGTGNYFYEVVPRDYIVEVDGTKYEAWTTASAAITSDSSVKLLKDITGQSTWLLSGKSNVTLDLNGFNLAFNNSVNVGANGSLTLTDSSADYLLSVNDDYTVSYTGGTLSCSYVRVYNDNSSFTLDKGKIAASQGFTIEAATRTSETPINPVVTQNGGLIYTPEWYGVFVQGNKAQFHMNDGVIYAAVGIGGNGTIEGTEDYSGTEINITGGTIIGCEEGEELIYHPQDGVLNITGGTLVINNGAGIVMRAGTLNMSGGTIQTSGSGTIRAGSAANRVPMSALVYDETVDYPGLSKNAPAIHITGGSLLSDGCDAITIQSSVSNPQIEDNTLIEGGVYSDDHLDASYLPPTYWMIPNVDAQTWSPGTLDLIDGEEYARTSAVSVPAGKTITYQRSFTEAQAGKYQAWLVPFDYTLQAEDLDKATFYKVHMISGSGVEGNSEVEDNEAVFIHIEKMSAGDVLYGNRPYVLVPQQAYSQMFTTSTTSTLLAKDPTSRLHLETAEWKYDFYGNYAEKGATGPNEWLAMNGGQICWNASASARLGSYRWFIQVESNSGNIGYAPSLFVFTEGRTATGIHTVSSAEGCQIEGIYSADGVRLNELGKGINIVRYTNGVTKKVVLR